MFPVKADPKLIGILFVLAITQIIGWGTVGLPAIVGREMAADLHMSITTAFAGTSVLYVVMGLCSPILGRAFTQFGARLVLIAGTFVAIPGFLLLSFAHGPVVYFAAWVMLGSAGSATLTTAAYVMLNDTAGKDAKHAIGALMLMTGLSSSVFWPITSALAGDIGWRGTCQLFALLLAAVSLPLYVFALPRHRAATSEDRLAGSVSSTPPVRRSTFYLIAGVIALNSFVTFGLSATMIELLRASGLGPSEAIAFGSSLGIIQVSARAIDFLGGRRWDGISTALFAGLSLPVAMLLLMAGGDSHWAIIAFLLLYGLGSGALAVARATIPLAFYSKADYAKAAAYIGLPLNIMSALSPPILVGLLSHFGSHALLALTIACSCTAFLLLILLARRRPVTEVAAAA